MSEAYALSVVAPCYNEAKNLPELVSRLGRVFEKRGLRGQVVLVNDGSRDETGAVADALAREHAHVVVVHHERNRGIAAGWDSGVARAEGEYVCLIDADLQNLPEDVWRLYREIRFSHADLVQGWRSTFGRQRDSRYLLSKGLNLLLNLLFDMNARDNKSGFVIARRETLQDVLHRRYTYHYFQTFVSVAARAKGYSIREIETLFESRLLGESFMPSFPVKVVLRCFADLARGVVEFRLVRRRDTVLADYLRTRGGPRRSEPRSGWRGWLFDAYFATMPAHKWMITRQARGYYEELQESQWLSPAQVRELQERKLRRLVAHAYAHVGWWRQRMDELGLRPTDVQTLDDLARLPFLEKADVRENLHFDLLADNLDKARVLKIATSGSTGEPFVCYADQHQLEIRWAATLRSMEWTGWRFGDRQARLWHQTIGMSASQAFRERCDALLSRRLFIPAFEISEERLERFVRQIERYQPALIDGYAESFHYLAEYLRRRGPLALRPKGIMSSAQALDDDSRRLIEQAFGCRVFDKYGSREFSGIAYECEAHDGHHVVAESYVVELLRDGRRALPGEVGEVVVTDLNNLCLPFIRYRIGDLAVAMDPDAACACGRGLPRLGRIEGRVQSLILGSNGAVIPGTFFAHLFKDYDWLVRQYQVVQERPGQITLKVVRGPRFDPAALEREILAALRRFLGAEMRIDVELLEQIPMVRTGKRQATLSRVALDFQRLPQPPSRP